MPGMWKGLGVASPSGAVPGEQSRARGLLWLWRRDGLWGCHHRCKRQHQAGFQNLPFALFRPLGILEFLHSPLCWSPALPQLVALPCRDGDMGSLAVPDTGAFPKHSQRAQGGVLGDECG